MINKSLHTQAFWLYSTIVALAIKEALTNTIPHLINPPPGPLGHRAHDAFRLVVFLVVTIRFYLGATIFFETAHAGETADEKYPHKSYVIDFLFGIFQFLLFLVWAFSIDIHSMPIKLFPAMLAIILFYDMIWLCVCLSLKYATQNLLKIGALKDFLILCFGALIYTVVSSLNYQSKEEKLAAGEEMAFYLIILISLVDIWDLLAEKRIYIRLLDLVRGHRP